MNIQVRWVKPSNYHIKFQNLHGNVGPLKKLYISKKINTVLKLPIQASIGNVRLGRDRNFKGLLYLELQQGGDELREMRYNMIKTLKIKDNVQYVPHIAIGRINKDLSKQEYSNILKDIDNVSRQRNEDKQNFSINQIDLVRIKDDDYEILKKFVTSS
jgi:2'-5' RNA ligase